MIRTETNRYIMEVQEKPQGWTDWDEPKGRPWTPNPARDISYKVTNLSVSRASASLDIEYVMLDSTPLIMRQGGTSLEVLSIPLIIPPFADVRGIVSLRLTAPKEIPTVGGGEMHMRVSLRENGLTVSEATIRGRQVRFD